MVEIAQVVIGSEPDPPPGEGLALRGLDWVRHALPVYLDDSIGEFPDDLDMFPIVGPVRPFGSPHREIIARSAPSTMNI